MAQRLRAAFVRGGTSKGLVFHLRDLPADRRRGAAGPLRLSMPSGVLTVDARVVHADGVWRAERGSFYRTTRRLFDGHVYA